MALKKLKYKLEKVMYFACIKDVKADNINKKHHFPNKKYDGKNKESI